MVGEACRRLRLSTHTKSDQRWSSCSYIRPAQSTLTRRISWNHFGSFHHIILILGTAGPLWVAKLMHVGVDPLICVRCSFENTGFKELAQDAMFQNSFFWLVQADLLLSSFASRKLSDLHNRLIAGASNAGSPPARRVSRHTQTLASGFTQTSFRELYENAQPNTREPVQKETPRAAHVISLRPPVYGILEGFGANPQHLTLINQIRECILPAVEAGQMQLGFCEAWRARINLPQGHKLIIYVCSSIHCERIESAKPEVCMYCQMALCSSSMGKSRKRATESLAFTLVKL